jgi:hypothetical protein
MKILKKDHNKEGKLWLVEKEEQREHPAERKDNEL